MQRKVEHDLSFQAPPEIVDALQPYGSELNQGAGTILFQRGQKACGLFLLKSGRVQLSVPGALQLWVGPGSLLGVPATISDTTYSLTAELLDECCLLFVPSARVKSLMAEHPEIGFHMVMMLSKEVQCLRKKISLLSSKAAVV